MWVIESVLEVTSPASPLIKVVLAGIIGLPTSTYTELGDYIYSVVVNYSAGEYLIDDRG